MEPFRLQIDHNQALSPVSHQSPYDLPPNFCFRSTTVSILVGAA